MALDLPEPAGPTTTMPCRTWQVSCSCRHLLSQGPCACRPASRMAERRAAWMPPAGTFSGFCPGKTSSSSLRKSGRSALTSLLVFMSRSARMSSWSSDLGAAVGGEEKERGCESLVSTLQFGGIRAPLAIAIFSLENPTLPNPPYKTALLGVLPLQGTARAQDCQDVAQPKVVVGLTRQLLFAQEVERVKLAGKRGVFLESAGRKLDLPAGGVLYNVTMLPCVSSPALTQVHSDAHAAMHT